MWYYATTKSFAGTDDFEYSTEGAANLGNLAFAYESFSGPPKRKTLTGVISTPASPHYDVAGNDIS